MISTVGGGTAAWFCACYGQSQIQACQAAPGGVPAQGPGGNSWLLPMPPAALFLHCRMRYGTLFCWRGHTPPSHAWGGRMLSRPARAMRCFP